MQKLIVNVTEEDIRTAMEEKQCPSARTLCCDPVQKALHRQYCMTVRISPVGGRFVVYGKDSIILEPNQSIAKYLQAYWAGKEVKPRTFRVKIQKLGQISP